MIKDAGATFGTSTCIIIIVIIIIIIIVIIIIIIIMVPVIIIIKVRLLEQHGRACLHRFNASLVLHLIRQVLSLQTNYTNLITIFNFLSS